MSLVMIAMYIAIPVVLFLVSKSVARTTVSIALVIAIGGGLLQTSVGLGAQWTLPGLQVLLAICLLVAFFIGWWGARRANPPTTSLRHQTWAVWVPSIVIGGIFLVLRLLASPNPGPLAGVGYLISHAAAEDNAKWLNLASHLASGEPLSFAGGYAGGPYLLIMTAVATAMTALSQIVLGGANEVAVATGTVIGSGFLLVMLVPFAFAPLVEKRWRSGEAESRRHAPLPALYAGMVCLALASTVVSGIGHQSLQLVMVMLTLWAVTFLVGGGAPQRRLLTTVIAIGVGVVWFPLNVFSLVILVATLGWLLWRLVRMFRHRDSAPWIPALVLLLAVMSYWDGLISSTIYALGLDGGVPISAQGVGSGIAAIAAVPADTAMLFSSPGGTESATAYLAIAAAASALGAALWLRNKRMTRLELSLAFAPLAVLAGYAALIAVADAVLTGSGTNYATLKMGFLVTVVILSATAPVAIMSLDPHASGMSPTRWVGAGALGFVLVIDSMLPRAIASAGPLHWSAPQADSQPYWTTFEVNGTANQPLSSLPIACVFLPPGAEKPAGNIDGQLTYSCTRFLIGLNGVEGNVGSLMEWISTDWLSNGAFWDDWYPYLEGTPVDIKNRPIVLLDSQGKVIGFETLAGLLNRFPPRAAS